MARKRASSPRYICVISDATGSTAERVVRATLVQFADEPVEVERIGKVQSVDQIDQVVAKTRRRKGLIAYTLVSSTLRGEMAARANEAGVASVDLIGPLITSLSDFLTASPAQKPGIFTHADGEHYARLEAVGFTVRHDDGLCLDEIDQADLVITGPSRASKTPISVYLAHTRGLKVANVPLALGVEPAAVLGQLPPGRVVGLTLSAPVLAEIRRQRLREMGNPEIEYAQLPFVEKELRYCHEVYRRPPPWPIVDVTSKSIEEIAAEICSLTVTARRFGEHGSPSAS